MNEHDRQNLNFLLTASPTVIADWFTKVDDDDIAYAQELLAMAALELKEQALALRIEAELSIMDRFEQAQAVIGKIKR
jgi:hypothetical protein